MGGEEGGVGGEAEGVGGEASRAATQVWSISQCLLRQRPWGSPLLPWRMRQSLQPPRRLMLVGKGEDSARRYLPQRPQQVLLAVQLMLPSRTEAALQSPRQQRPVASAPALQLLWLLWAKVLLLLLLSKQHPTRPASLLTSRLPPRG